ncbi:cytochrome c biogenesis CcdA family protein [Mycetocola zhujimingii]|uniref:Cytochrome C biogenesis protein n=1 Tax=Mycetocola zhujimingii TaxID=2079792 RepID=A0A2U1TAC2_9MICO|nr:cytochrome c biogenesis protein CcdA [Mycetocola zhujimingii]PWC04623.1 cytochrome C biogenesis protein [Mycetocola zhujimingii]
MNPGEIIFNGQLLAAIPIALLAGLVSFASPCVLPLVPGYLGYVGGMSNGARSKATPARSRVLLGATLFVLGFSLVFVLIGAFAGTVGAFVVRWEDIITRVLGVVVIVMGLVFIGQFSFLQRTVKSNFRPATGLAGAPLLGIVFAVGWTPCLGPTLIAINALSFESGSTGRGAILALFYCVGLGIPFILVAAGLNWVTGSVAFLKRHIRAINIGGGILLVIIGVLMVTGVWGIFMSKLGVVISGFVPAI